MANIIKYYKWHNGINKQCGKGVPNTAPALAWQRDAAAHRIRR